MPTFSSPHRTDVALAASSEELEARPEPGTGLRLLVLGDFSGRESRQRSDPETLGAGRAPIPVDREDLDEVLARLRVEVRVSLPEGAEALLRPRCLDDFHPDRILEREPAFLLLRRIREGLTGEADYEEAARVVRSWDAASAAAATPDDRGGPSAGAATPEASDLLAEMLTGGSRPVPPAKSDRELDGLVASLVRPHLEPGEPADRARLIARTEQEIGRRMRDLLHAPAFQSVEAAWRGLDFLLRTLETGDSLRVEVLDVTKEEVARDLKSAASLTDTGLHRILTAGKEDSRGTWTAAACLYTFGPTVDDVALLARLSRIAAGTGTPFLAAAGPSLLACDRLDAPPDPRRWLRLEGTPAEELWAALRQQPDARFLGLAAPRFLLRLPYGEDTDPAERFDFEESEAGLVHDQYLWGNPALLCLASLVSPGTLAGFPVHVFEREGESRIQPCVETLLPSSVAEAMLERGLIPIIAVAGRDEVRAPRMRSVADPPAPLATPGPKRAT